MTPDDWLRSHAYLQPVASLCAAVGAALAAIETQAPHAPRWDDYAPDFSDGVPLLSSPAAAVDLEPAVTLVGELVARLGQARLPGQPGAELRRSLALLQRELGPPRRIADWLLGGDSPAPSAPGLLRYLGWSAAARWLEPVVSAFAAWRDDQRWMRPYCPTCGSAPAMAQLVGADPGRKRFLACGCCRTRWQFSRTKCPYCEVDTQRLAVVGVTGEAGLRIDYCEACKGYLKTLDGQRDEALLLADWSSLHLDLLALDRGLQRKAGSLYDLETVLAAPAT
jgi:FdhE protein